MQPKCPFQAVPSCAPCVRLTEIPMSSAVHLVGLRSRTRSIHCPEISASALRLSVVVSTSILKRPTSVVDAALPFYSPSANQLPHHWIILAQQHIAVRSDLEIMKIQLLPSIKTKPLIARFACTLLVIYNPNLQRT